MENIKQQPPHPTPLAQAGEGINTNRLHSLARLRERARVRGLLYFSFLLLPTISFASTTSQLTIKTAEKTITFNIEIAKTPEEQALGLMDRKTLAKNAGMLFVYDEPAELSFWMKNTLIPLDIIFMDESKKIVDIQTMTPCHSIPCPVYNSAKPAQYALEINAGLSKQNHLAVGDTVVLSK